MVSKLILVYIAILVTSSLINQPLLNAKDSQWIRYPGNPVLSPTPGSWDADFVIQPRVLYDNRTDSFRMWYVGSNQNITGIGYATSNDGISWTKHAGPVLTPGQQAAWDNAFVGLGSVISNGTSFLMWYLGSGGLYEHGAVGLAMSSDGISWVRYRNNPVLKPTSIDQRFLTTPYVLKIALYNMWYAGRGANDPASSPIIRIVYANSLDGVNWSKLSPASLTPSSNSADWDSESVYSPSVIYDEFNLQFGMWYSALKQGSLIPSIGHATSKDGFSWNKSAGNPILGPGAAGSWDSLGVENPDAVTSRSGFLLYYDGIGESIGARIGLARAPEGFQIPEFPLQTASLVLGVLTSLAMSFKISHENAYRQRNGNGRRLPHKVL